MKMKEQAEKKKREDEERIKKELDRNQQTLKDLAQQKEDMDNGMVIKMGDKNVVIPDLKDREIDYV